MQHQQAKPGKGSDQAGRGWAAAAQGGSDQPEQPDAGDPAGGELAGGIGKAEHVAEHVAGARARVRDMPPRSRAVAAAANGPANDTMDPGLSPDASRRRWISQLSGAWSS